MKTLSALLGILLLVCLAALFLEHGKVADLQAALASVSDDRDAMSSALKKSDQRLAEIQQRQAAAPLAAPETPRAAQATVAAPITPVATSGVTVTAPAGWGKNGTNGGQSYVVGVDQNQSWGGMPSAYVKSLAPSVEGFGGMMQMASPDSYIGKRIRLSGWVKTEDANDGGGQLWLRVDGQERGKSLQFDNMNNRAVKGTSDWQEASVVLDVPEGATALAYGFFVKGGGTMWVSGTKIEEVGLDVPSTNMLSQRPVLPKGAVNLGFDPAKPK